MNIKRDFGFITITISEDHLVNSVEEGLSHSGYTITNREQAIDAIVETLQIEDEDGSTMLHRVFDQAAVEAIEQGDYGFDEV